MRDRLLLISYMAVGSGEVEGVVEIGSDSCFLIRDRTQDLAPRRASAHTQMPLAPHADMRRGVSPSSRKLRSVMPATARLTLSSLKAL
jgi:hypothetical protein